MKYSHIKRTMIGCIIVLSALSAGPAAAVKIVRTVEDNRLLWNSAEHSKPTYKEKASHGGGCLLTSLTTVDGCIRFE